MATNGQQQEEAKKTTIWEQRFTLILFWIAFLSFLAVSIPHVAWLYLTYEPQNGWSLLTSYGVAIGIDVMIAWLSYAQVAGSGRKTWMTWVFISLLSLLSWYANYLFDLAHGPVQIDIWSIELGWWGLRAGDVTPFIISAIPLFSLGYTFMLSLIGNRNVESLEEMQARLDDLTARKDIEAQLKELKKGRFKNAIKARIDDGKELYQHAVKTEAVDVPQISQQDAQESSILIETKTESITNDGAGSDPDEKTEEEGVKTLVPDASKKRSTEPLSVSVKEASARLNLSESYVRDLKKNGKLRNPPRNKNLITVASLSTYQKTRQKDGKKEPNTDELEAVKTPSNEQPKSNGNGHIITKLSDFVELPV